LPTEPAVRPAAGPVPAYRTCRNRIHCTRLQRTLFAPVSVPGRVQCQGQSLAPEPDQSGAAQPATLPEHLAAPSATLRRSLAATHPHTQPERTRWPTAWPIATGARTDPCRHCATPADTGLDLAPPSGRGRHSVSSTA